MGAVGLQDILITPLNRIPTPGGDVMHALKASADGYSGFGEVYFTWIEPGSIKAWKKHNQMVMNLVVPYGIVQLVFYDDAEGTFRSETIGDTNYVRVTVPAGIWFGFKGIGTAASLMLNIASIEHDPAEVDRLTLTNIKYNW